MVSKIVLKKQRRAFEEDKSDIALGRPLIMKIAFWTDLVYQRF